MTYKKNRLITCSVSHTSVKCSFLKNKAFVIIGTCSPIFSIQLDSSMSKLNLESKLTLTILVVFLNFNSGCTKQYSITLTYTNGFKILHT